MTETNLIHTLETDENKKFAPTTFVIMIAAMLVVGVIVGFGAAQMTAKKTSSTAAGTSSQGTAQQSTGIKDKSTFKDSAEGILREGGFESEGNFHLERPGGTSQNAYLTSTAVDLSQFVGKKVRVWGQTFKGQKAAWLMDVGLVEPL